MQTETLKVTGMTCGGCTSNVTRAIRRECNLPRSTEIGSEGRRLWSWGCHHRPETPGQGWLLQLTCFDIHR
jgi:hypothetical protein